MSDDKEAVVKKELEKLHQNAFHWALSCTGFSEYLAEEVLQESYYRLLKNIDKYDIGQPLKPWFFTIIRNTSKDIFRKKQCQVDKEDSYAQQAKFYKTSSQVLSIQKAKDQKQIKTFLSMLSSREREIIDLVYYQQLTIKEAAQVMNVKEGSASSYLKSAKKRLKGIILTPERPDSNTPAFDATWTCSLELFSRKKAA